MFKKIILSSSLLLASSLATAEIQPFINADVGYGDTDFETEVYFALGGGIKFNDNVELEVGYNDYGEVGPLGIDVTSYAVGLNLGGRVGEKVRFFATLGGERLEAEDTVSNGIFSFEVDESSTEAFFGVGMIVEASENVVVRTKLVNHDSGDLMTFGVGLGVYF